MRQNPNKASGDPESLRGSRRGRRSCIKKKCAPHIKELALKSTTIKHNNTNSPGRLSVAQAAKKRQQVWWVLSREEFAAFQKDLLPLVLLGASRRQRRRKHNKARARMPTRAFSLSKSFGSRLFPRLRFTAPSGTRAQLRFAPHLSPGPDNVLALSFMRAVSHRDATQTADTAPRPGRRAQAARWRKCGGWLRERRVVCATSRKGLLRVISENRRRAQSRTAPKSREPSLRREPDEVQLVDLALSPGRVRPQPGRTGGRNPND